MYTNYSGLIIISDNQTFFLW